ncbi:MAG: bifunctional glutamate N-acetyltransferase/amino-acid acetyltransferase ArgJ [Candidatus Omnitrophota bacterium]
MSHTIESVAHGTVTTPKGFKAAGVAAGIKGGEKLDLGILVSQVRCTAAGVFTTNAVKGASLLTTKEHLADGYAQAVIVNSGNANACTGERGLLDAKEMARALSRQLNIPVQDVLPSSTGVIGVYLPLPQIRDGVEKAVPRLREDGGEEMARAMMTTDTKPKYAARRVIAENQTFCLGGVAKGAGMIHPNMATMLVFLTTDARVDRQSLQTFLSEEIGASFNRFTIDGDTSCDDTVLLLANGLAGGRDIACDDSPLANAFREALHSLCLDLTMQLARDGEGVTKTAIVCVKGACTRADAVKIARSIAVSPLVKTAIHGQDPNWGRIINAAGYSGADFDPDCVDLWIGDVQVMERGERGRYEEEAAAQVMRGDGYEIILDLRQGTESDFYITTDFSNAYIDINADYRHRT